jgi:glycosyltransferase involved in cell wall biosynthesis
LARRLGLPLHLICHDDILSHIPKGVIRRYAECCFARAYLSASSRLCVSPFMEMEYAERFAVSGSVFYPFRGGDCPTYSALSPRTTGVLDHPVAAYAGSISSFGYQQALQQVAQALQTLGGRLHIYGPPKDAQSSMKMLQAANIEFRGFAVSSHLIPTLRAEADILFLPMAFDPEMQVNMRLSFPSKLTDYTAAGLPILIQGPEYCSGVKWAKMHPGVAAVVEDPSVSSLTKELAYLSRHPEKRQVLGRRALQIGQEEFAFERAKALFISALKGTP